MANYFSYPTLSSSLSKGFDIFHLRSTSVSRILKHSHEFYELYYFIHGNVTYKIDGTDYPLKSGDILLIPPNTTHEPIFSSSKQTYERIILWFSSELIDELSGPDSKLHKCFNASSVFSLENNSFFRDRFKNLLEELIYENSTSIGSNNTLFASGDYYKVLLSHLLIIVNRTFNSDAPKNKDDKVKLISEIISYINRNLEKDLSLDMLADKFYISKYYLSRKFKDETKISIHQYIQKQRLLKAERLIYNGTPPTNACEICGFKDYSSFFRAFKKEFNISPKELKR